MNYPENINLPSHGLTDKEKSQADEELLRFRKGRLGAYTEKEELLARLMQLKYKIEDFVSSPLEENKMTGEVGFGSFLAQYIKVLNRKQEDFAFEIDIHPTKLSRIINSRDEPKPKLFYRLEIHSGHTISAVTWWKSFIKLKEKKLAEDVDSQRKEATHVRNGLQFGV